MTFTVLTKEDLRAIASAIGEIQGPLDADAVLDLIAQVISGEDVTWADIEALQSQDITSCRAAKAKVAQASASPKAAAMDRSSIPLPKTDKGRPIADLIGVSYSSAYPSGSPDGPIQPDTPMNIHSVPALDLGVGITACKTPNLMQLIEGLEAMPHARPLVFKRVHVDDLSPNQVNGRRYPLFLDSKTCVPLYEDSLGTLGFDDVPVLAFIENAWSETLKTVDDALAGRFMRWQFTVSDSQAQGLEVPASPLAVFHVTNEERFREMVRRYMPFTYQELTYQNTARATS